MSILVKTAVVAFNDELEKLAEKETWSEGVKRRAKWATTPSDALGRQGNETWKQGVKRRVKWSTTPSDLLGRQQKPPAPPAAPSMG